MRQQLLCKNYEAYRIYTFVHPFFDLFSLITEGDKKPASASVKNIFMPAFLHKRVDGFTARNS